MLEYLYEFLNIRMMGESFVKLILIVVLAGLIGWEREKNSKPAGFKTHIILGISAVLVALCGEYVYDKTGADPTRIPAQLLSGIGFLGAGTILRDGFNVKGLTTAASLLAVTIIGLCIGEGFFFAGILATFIVFIVLSFSKAISERIDTKEQVIFEIKGENLKDSLKEIRDVLEMYNVYTKNIKNTSADTIEIVGEVVDDFKADKVVFKLMGINGVDEARLA